MPIQLNQVMEIMMGKDIQYFTEMVYQLLVGVCLAFTTLGNSLNKASKECVRVCNTGLEIRPVPLHYFA